jgi:hypothetical protein
MKSNQTQNNSKSCILIMHSLKQGMKRSILNGRWIPLYIFELRHDKTNIMCLQPAWIQTSLLIRAVWSGFMLVAISFPTCSNIVGQRLASWSCVDVQAGLDPCWPQTHYVGFVMSRLIYWWGKWVICLICFVLYLEWM